VYSRCLFVLGLAVSTLATPARAQDRDALTLKQAIDMARTRSADVIAARADAEAADAAADRALAGYLPSASANVGANARHDDPGAGPTPGFTRAASVGGGIHWTPFNFGQTPHTVAAARAEARAAAHGAQATSNEAVRLVATTFLSAIFDELVADNARASIRIRERHAVITHGLVASGLRSNVEEGRARLELDLAKLEATAADRQLAQDRARLATLLMLDPTTPLRLVRPSVLPTIPADPNAAANQASSRRPEVRAANENVQAQDEAVSAASAARLPTLGLDLEAGYQTQATVATPTFQGNTFVAGGASISIPIFNWDIWGEVAVQRSRLSAAQARQAATTQQVKREAALAIHALHAARLSLDQAKTARELSGAMLSVMEGRYQMGLATPTDLFDAAGRDADARRETIKAEAGLAVATIEALAASGRLTELER
jgi:outer membrane protein